MGVSLSGRQRRAQAADLYASAAPVDEGQALPFEDVVGGMTARIHLMAEFRKAGPGLRVTMTPRGGGFMPGRDRFSGTVLRRRERPAALIIRWDDAADGGPPPGVIARERAEQKSWWDGPGEPAMCERTSVRVWSKHRRHISVVLPDCYQLDEEYKVDREWWEGHGMATVTKMPEPNDEDSDDDEGGECDEGDAAEEDAQGLKVGDEVLMRNKGQLEWKDGVVTEVVGDRPKVRYFGKNGANFAGMFWDEVETKGALLKQMTGASCLEPLNTMQQQSREDRRTQRSMQYYLRDRQGLATFCAECDVAMVKGAYIIQLWKEGRGLPRRQDIPPEGLVQGRKLQQALAPSARGPERALAHPIVVSYCWQARDAADPHGDLVATLAKEGGWGSRALNSPPAAGGSGAARRVVEGDLLFIDYASLPQAESEAHRASPAFDDRTPEQRGRFAKAVECMAVLYASSFTNVAKVEGLRHHSGDAYRDRAWTVLETLCAAMKDGAAARTYTITPQPPEAGRYSPRPAPVFEPDVRAPPSPETFRRQLQFLRTTDDADRELIARVYTNLYRVKAPEMTGLFLGGLPPTQLGALVDTLAGFGRLTALHLHGSPGLLTNPRDRDDDGAASRLAGALGGLRCIRFVNLSKCGLHDEAIAPFIALVMGREMHILAAGNPAVSADKVAEVADKKRKGLMKGSVTWKMQPGDIEAAEERRRKAEEGKKKKKKRWDSLAHIPDVDLTTAIELYQASGGRLPIDDD